MRNIKISVVILNYNSSDDLIKCLNYIEQQTYDNMEIIIVDNASTNVDEKDRIKSLCKGKKYKVILNPVNLGYSAGNNIGLRYAINNQSEWCLIVNPDVELRDKKYIENVLHQVESYPSAVVVGTNILLPSGERQNPIRESTFREELLWPIESIMYKLGLFNGYLDMNKTGYCCKVSGCCLFIKSMFIKEINYFDSNVFLYCEESILAAQVKKKKYKELYIKELTAYHCHIKSQKGSNSKRMKQFLDSRIYYLKNYSEYKGIKLRLLIMSRLIQKQVWKIRR